MASIVVTAALPTLSMLVMQERVGVPSRCTVQAPQSAIPQPNRAGHAENVTKHPQQRGVAVDIGGASTPLTLIVKAMVGSGTSIRCSDLPTARSLLTLGYRLPIHRPVKIGARFSTKAF